MRRPIVWGIIGVVAALVMIPVVVPLVFMPWTKLNCEQQDINIKTGQARYTRYIWYVKTSERIDDTAISKALQGETVDVAAVKPWQRVNTFSLGVLHSPNYLFHGAFGQIREMAMADKVTKFTPERRREVARTMLELWQKSGNYHGCKDYVRKLTYEPVQHTD